MKNSYEVQKNGQVADIFIYGLIGGYWDEVGASAFVKEFKQLEQTCERINIRINSPGGSLFEGLAIYNAIAQSTVDTHCYNDGIAYSMGGLILLAGKTVHAAKNSMFLIHNASGLVVGNAQSMRAAADDLDKYDASIAQSIATRLGIEVQEVLSTYFDYKDHLFTAQEAFDLGFIDVLEEKTPPAPAAAPAPAEAPEDVENMSYQQILNYYSKANGTPQANSSIWNKLHNAVSAAIKPKATPAAASTGTKLFSQADLDQKVTALATEHQQQLESAQNQLSTVQAESAEWKRLAEKYGAMPGDTHTNATATKSEINEGTIQDAPSGHLFSEAQAAARFQPRF